MPDYATFDPFATSMFADGAMLDELGAEIYAAVRGLGDAPPSVRDRDEQLVRDHIACLRMEGKDVVASELTYVLERVLKGPANQDAPSPLRVAAQKLRAASALVTEAEQLSKEIITYTEAEELRTLAGRLNELGRD